jgi:hypothetical protein
VGIGGSGGSVGGIVTDASISDASTNADSTCAASTTTGKEAPLDLFIMLDQSISMNTPVGNGTDTRWRAVTKAIGAFVQRPEAAGLGVGINYFGPLTDETGCLTGLICTTDDECGPGCGPCAAVPGFADKGCEGHACDLRFYARAETAIAPLPGNAQAIIDSLARHRPNTPTPTSPALQGAVNFSKQWAIDHPGRPVVVILATDGEPSQCDVNPANIQAIAGTAFIGMPSIRTFVIGVGDVVAAPQATAAKDLLNGIARAGGTSQAFIINDTDVNAQFLAALQAIRGAALQCAYTIPDSMGKMPDFNKVNVRYTPGGGMSSIIPKVANAGACAMDEGWYYDNELAPTRILVCPATCDKFAKAMGGKVEIEVGCATIIAPPR